MKEWVALAATTGVVYFIGNEHITRWSVYTPSALV